MFRAVVMLVAALAATACQFEPRGIVPGGEVDAPVLATDDGGTVIDDAATTDDDDGLLSDAAASTPDAPLAVDATPIDAAPPTDAPVLTEMACGNGDDDDHDGTIDCRDDDCPGCGLLTSCCASGACALICL